MENGRCNFTKKFANNNYRKTSKLTVCAFITLRQPLLQTSQRWLSWDLKWQSWALRTYKVSTELCWNSPPAGRDAQLWWRQLDRGPNQYPEIIEADWAGLWHYYIIGWSLVSKNIMNLTIKYPRFNKNIRKSQVVTWPKSCPLIGSNNLAMRNRQYKDNQSQVHKWASFLWKKPRHKPIYYSLL